LKVEKLVQSYLGNVNCEIEENTVCSSLDLEGLKKNVCAEKFNGLINDISFCIKSFGGRATRTCSHRKNSAVRDTVEAFSTVES
jgi:hypothetical protein